VQIVIAGHVDHGKSTVIGRLLADTGSLPQGRLEQLRADCERNSKPFEYAFLLDALKDEQSQGITIDAARIFFESDRRPYLILDAPGHIEFLKNMVTGASQAEAALLVIDAQEGVQENSRRHGYMLSLLGIRQIVVVVNKMDLVDYDAAVFARVEAEYRAFLKALDLEPTFVLPVSGRAGDNIVSAPSQHMDWFSGPTVLGALDALEEAPLPTSRPFRMPVQDIYKFTRGGDDRRIVAGTIEGGSLHVGDEVAFYPSGKRSRVRTIEAFAREPLTAVGAGAAVGFTLEEQIYITRGELAVRTDQAPPEVSTRVRASLFWLGKAPLVSGKEYLLKIGTARVPMHLERIDKIIDASTLASQVSKTQVDRHDVAECVLKLQRPIACDAAAMHGTTGRFVIVDDYDICGGGIVLETRPDEQRLVREQVFLRNNRWEKSFVDAADRAERYNQRATLVLVTGPKDGRRKEVAKALEQRLFREGKLVYYLGFSSVLYGVHADLVKQEPRAADLNEAELMHRLGEVAHILLDAGILLIVTAQDLRQVDLETFKTIVDPGDIETVWVGSLVGSDLSVDLELSDVSDEEAVELIKQRLRDRGSIFRV
jgi:bifunctional enzyme CysN/CysC